MRGGLQGRGGRGGPPRGGGMGRGGDRGFGGPGGRWQYSVTSDWFSWYILFGGVYVKCAISYFSGDEAWVWEVVEILAQGEMGVVVVVLEVEVNCKFFMAWFAEAGHRMSHVKY